MQFTLLFHETADDFAARTDPARSADYWGGWTAFIGAMAEAGVMLRGDGLQGPHAATTVRLRDGARVVEDGPVADSKEQLAGFVVIEAPDLDAAVAWAERAPAARTAAVEVRPVMPPMSGG